MSDLFAQDLAAGGRISRPVALVVAHPDDETLWAGNALGRLDRLCLIHLTDGAPADMSDATRLGFATREAYAAARRAELDRALNALGFRGERVAYRLADQEVVDAVGWLTNRLVADCAGVSAILTHPYEGGHPDHDAAALACRLAADRLGCALVEFACYHQVEGDRQFGRFWPDPASPERARPLDAGERARLDTAVAAFESQAFVIGGWRPDAERWRAAPRYDFSAPPPPGAALYDGFGWAMTSARWRTRALACTS